MKVLREAFNQKVLMFIPGGRMRGAPAFTFPVFREANNSPSPRMVVVTYTPTKAQDLRMCEALLPTHVHEAATFSTNGLC